MARSPSRRAQDMIKGLRGRLSRIIGRPTPDRFSRIVLEGLEQNHLPGRTAKSREWYRSKAQEETDVTVGEVTSMVHRFAGAPTLGKMYMYQYYPKNIDTLPYHDRFPVVFPFERFEGGFIGLNLHYLPLDLRAVLMDALYSTTNREIDSRSRINITYEILTMFAKFEPAKPCIKKYLYPHVVSRFIEIGAMEWDVALFLPLERFAIGRGNPNPLIAKRVHADSIRYKK